MRVISSIYIQFVTPSGGGTRQHKLYCSLLLELFSWTIPVTRKKTQGVNILQPGAENVRQSAKNLFCFELLGFPDTGMISDHQDYINTTWIFIQQPETIFLYKIFKLSVCGCFLFSVYFFIFFISLIFFILLHLLRQLFILLLHLLHAFVHLFPTP
jgi:hypothetical protein